jgi:hypothetical protein
MIDAVFPSLPKKLDVKVGWFLLSIWKWTGGDISVFLSLSLSKRRRKKDMRCFDFAFVPC